MKMAHELVVGDEGVRFDEILNVILYWDFTIHYASLRRLAIYLDVPSYEIGHMKKRSLLGIETNVDLLHDILIIWRSRKGSEATLERLCDAFRKTEMDAIADELLNCFRAGSKLPDYKIFDPATPNAKREVPTEKTESLCIPGPSTSSQGKDEFTTEPSGEDESSRDVIKKTPSFALLAQQVGNTDIYIYRGKLRLGQGATSLVYQGYFGNVETLAAVKEIKKKDRDIFYAELNTFMNLMGDQQNHHPNVVKLFQWMEHDDWFYLAMEKATYDLRDFLAIAETTCNTSLDRKIMLKISLDCVNGLKFLHDNKILHRDIKPENILIFENNLAKLGDFGTSRKMNSLVDTLSISRGTEVWMSPEALDALHHEKPFPNSKALDIFTLGMTIFFTFSKGTHPFDKSKQHGKWPQMNIKDPNVEPMKLEKIDGNVTNTHLIYWMMQKIPKNRPDINQVLGHPMWTT